MITKQMEYHRSLQLIPTRKKEDLGIIMEQFVQDNQKTYDFEAEDSEDNSEDFETKKIEIDNHI